jgi:hypothetical protein
VRTYDTNKQKNFINYQRNALAEHLKYHRFYHLKGLNSLAAPLTEKKYIKIATCLRFFPNFAAKINLYEVLFSFHFQNAHAFCNFAHR